MNELSRKVRQPLELSFRPPIFNDDVFPLHVTKFAQSLPESLRAVRAPGRGGG